MASFVRDEYPELLEGYVHGKKDTDAAYESLLRLLRRFAYRVSPRVRAANFLSSQGKNALQMCFSY
ncbi:hypothetical protein PC116_g4051 [Phytophthora cactorum]|uniref:Uncharacterized protein n=1 Tax=Phytophthora cactorum TaxID=29920 RepID=A0A329T008_9STRA|nr:hypothetical protein Pcac1_g6322 [Phytophthora cactorum]KAG2931349.1 hypothetical protein PC114_g2206 [Phytophthora cactorum]KAG2953345.1 hypothetical protein PC117_g2066 [Phytophthora cactorum]KAG3040439.1 hypothetical protein PC119_g1437 [Phytophthora cactorum]KAG3190997.1 hypothetical protein C6341_g1437 [Phytophthora cactorum]